MTDPIVILLVEDESAHVEAIRRAFQAADVEIEIQVAGSLREYRASVAARPPDIALIDLNLPDGRALEVLTFPPIASPFPILIMTCYGNEQIAVEAMKAGALDYLVKSPEAFADMPRTAERALREWNLLRESKRAAEALRASEERYRQLFDNISSGAAVYEVKGNGDDFVFVDFNKAGERLDGDLKQNLLGKSIYTARPGIREFGLLDVFRRVWKTGIPEHYPAKVYRDQKGNKWYENYVYRLPTGEIVAVYDDITERMRIEERIRTFSQEIIAAREEERKQVSSVLHHDVGSLAVGIAAHLDAIEEDLRSGKPGEALKWLKRTRKLFNETVVRLKAVAVQLRPPELDVLGLSAALRQYFSQLTERGATRIHFREILRQRRISGDTATILFRVAQEALTNAIKHGHAKQVDVSLRALKKEVRLTVRDNGKGFDPSEHWARATSQMGLRVMREMAALAGGAFGVDSRRGKGTTVLVSLPMK